MGKDYHAAVLDLARRLRGTYGERLARLVAFGSHARGDATEDSDIDILVVLRIAPQEEPRERTRVWDEATSTMNARPGLFAPLSIFVFSEATFSDMKRREIRFASEIEREGVPL
ncbi:MAG: nucleotidyltransferase domain-containing protein [Planctomycetes bacterium]|nr:nucleotidyltransferase domain-containing protein [Planctomycetota bacterium]